MSLLYMFLIIIFTIPIFLGFSKMVPHIKQNTCKYNHTSINLMNQEEDEDIIAMFDCDFCMTPGWFPATSTLHICESCSCMIESDSKRKRDSPIAAPIKKINTSSQFLAKPNDISKDFADSEPSVTRNSSNTTSIVSNKIDTTDDFYNIVEIESLGDNNASSAIVSKADSNSSEDFSCLICTVDLSHMTENEREYHIVNCIIDMEDVSIQAQQPSRSAIMLSQSIGESPAEGVRGAIFYCVLCDVDLSKRSVVSRCFHLKKCAKQKSVETRTLLQLIAPIFDEQDAESENEDNNENDNDNNDDDVDDADFVNIISESSTTKGSESTTSNNQQEKKNAWSVLMASSKAMALKNVGGFEKSTSITKSTVQSKTTANIPRSSTWPIRDNSNDTIGKATNKATIASMNAIKSNKRYSNQTKPKKLRIPGFVPHYKKIQIGNMTKPIIVDGFQYASDVTDCYILTHFHSDHYVGLESDFDCGYIYCSPPTAGLVRQKLRVNGQRIIALGLNKVHTIGVGGVDVKVIFTDANHCPGAICALFLFDNGKRVLHTGDFRWNTSLMLQDPVFKSITPADKTQLQKNLTVYLDTTYCDPNYDFPDQTIAIQAVVSAVQSEMLGSKALYLFGAYGIGKERVYMAVAHALGVKVHVDKTRWKGMLCFDWPVETQAKLTTNPNESTLWVVPINQINFHSIEKLLAKRRDCQRVVAFQPTGWTHDGGKGAKGYNNNNNNNNNHHHHHPDLEILKVRNKGNNKIYAVPYSEHSSFGELVEFIKIFRPNVVIPTVNVREDKVKEQLNILRNASDAYKFNSIGSDV